MKLKMNPPEHHAIAPTSIAHQANTPNPEEPSKEFSISHILLEFDLPYQ
jgi:hypothetical protein